MGQSPINADKAAARAFAQSREYTDARVTELEQSLRQLRIERYRDNRKTLKSRLVLHAAFILSGMAISAALIACAASPVIMAIITCGPSVITEIIDYIKRFLCLR